MSSSKPWYADWTQYICPGPTRRFTPAEMARGGDAPFPAGIGRYVAVNTATLVLAMGIVLQRSSPALMGAIGLVGIVSGVFALVFAKSLWRDPHRVRLNLGSLALMLLLSFGVGLGSALAENLGVLSPNSGKLVIGATTLMAVMVVAGWYFLAMYRAQQIEGRLRERDAQDARESLQRRLATAQIHPHFVFNTLASLTHWVESGDPRAAPLLREFNAYLRATLPMFEREQQSLGAELDLVRHYLAIMKARLGDRLEWAVEADPSLHELALPPGSLLTLVENAITHGIEPSLRGGRIALDVARVGAHARLSVRDSGAGLHGNAPEGLGLSNTRERLLALHPGARQTLTPNDDGGCTATLEIPL